MQPLSEIIKTNFLVDREKLLFLSLWKNWDKVIGKPLAEYIFPLGRKNRVLLLGTEEGIILQEAYFLSVDILKKVNNFLGKEVFDKVQVKLLEGRTPLNKITVPAPKRLKLSKPRGELGKVGDKLKRNPAVYSCYLAYVRYFQEIEAQKEEEK